MLLPPPEGPTSATVAPAGTSKLTSAQQPAPRRRGRRSVTLLKAIRHAPGALRPASGRTSSMGSAARISFTRRTESSAIMSASDAYITLLITVVVKAENTT